MVRVLTEKRSYWKWFVNADHAFVYANVLLNIWFDHQWRSWKSKCLQKYVSWYPLPEVMAPLKRRKKRIEKFSVTPCCQMSALLPKSWRWKNLFLIPYARCSSFFSEERHKFHPVKARGGKRKKKWKDKNSYQEFPGISSLVSLYGKTGWWEIRILHWYLK